MKLPIKNRSRYVAGGFVAALTAAGIMLAGSAPANANPSPRYDLDISGIVQEHPLNVGGVHSHSIDVTRGAQRSQLISNLAGCMTRAHVLNVVILDPGGQVVESLNLYDACITRITNGSEVTISFSHMTVTSWPASS